MALLWVGGYYIRDQSRDFHTANYSKLINQHNVISCTHMQSACWWVGMSLKRVGTAAVWICLCTRDKLLSHNRTQTHTLCPLPWSLHHIRGMFSGRFLCADRTPTKLSYICTSYLTRRLSARIAQSLASNYRAYSAGEGGCAKRAKSFSCAQHKHTHSHRQAGYQ